MTPGECEQITYVHGKGFVPKDSGADSARDTSSGGTGDGGGTSGHPSQRGGSGADDVDQRSSSPYWSTHSAEEVKKYEFDSLLMYMYGEMVLNPSSPPAEHIEDCQGLFPLVCVPNEYEVWLAMVWPHGKWDHKDRILESLELEERGTLFTPIPGSSSKAISYDFWSNLHYGYLGREVGFAECELQAGANAADLVLHQQTFPADQLAIQIGIDLRKKYKASELKPKHIKRVIAANLPALTQAGAVKTCPNWPYDC